MSTLKDIAQECSTLIRSGYPLLYLYSWEEDRIQAMWEAIGRSLKREVHIWTVTDGFLDKPGKLKDPLEAIEKLSSGDTPGIFLFKDFHPFLADPLVVRALRSAMAGMRKKKRSLGLVGPILSIPREIEKDVYIVDIPLPSEEEIGALLDQFIAQVSNGHKPEEEVWDALVRSAQGLTFSEMQRVFSRFLCLPASENGHNFERAVDLIHTEKSQILRRSRVLEFYSEMKKMGDVGGLDNLKGWLKQRQLVFSEKAREFGLPQPKGLFLLGVQGCGKSLMAKAAAGYWHLPLLRMDVASLVSNRQASEGVNLMMDALKVAESLSPVVLWLDEIEKAFSGLDQDGNLTRHFGTFITWMQEKTAPVFVVATANSIKNLPPELLRKGRFDEIFFVDLPDVHEREEIVRIHLTLRNRDPKKFPIEDLAKKSEGFSGSEIEQVIIDALFLAFSQNRKLQPQDIAEALEETVPLSTTMEEEIKELKEWARTRSRRASTDTKRIDYFE